MKKKLTTIICLFLTFLNVTFSQKFYTKTGETKFIGSVETFEPVQATNKSTTSILNTENGEFASLLFISAFDFKVALMQEHFNENYMDTENFPKSTFKGKLSEFEFQKINEKQTEYSLIGILNIKGIEKEITTTSLLKKEGNKLIMTGDFKVKPEDFDIKIPDVVKEKISNEILIKYSYELVEKK